MDADAEEGWELSNHCSLQIDDKAVQTPFEGNAQVLLSFPEVGPGAKEGACIQQA